MHYNIFIKTINIILYILTGGRCYVCNDSTRCGPGFAEKKEASSQSSRTQKCAIQKSLLSIFMIVGNNLPRIPLF